MELEEVWFKYEKGAPDVVKGLVFPSLPGEMTAILGGNGTGKTTTLSLIAGLNCPYRGKVKINGTELAKIPSGKLFDRLLGVLPQNPQSLFVAKTVREDLLEILSEFGLNKQEKQEKLRNIVSLCRLESLLDSHPYDLSGGEQQRAALAKVLLLQPRILLLDEPTKGLDAEYKGIFAAILRRLTAAGRCHCDGVPRYRVLRRICRPMRSVFRRQYRHRKPAPGLFQRQQLLYLCRQPHGAAPAAGSGDGERRDHGAGQYACSAAGAAGGQRELSSGRGAAGYFQAETGSQKADAGADRGAVPVRFCFCHDGTAHRSELGGVFLLHFRRDRGGECCQRSGRCMEIHGLDGGLCL